MNIYKPIRGELLHAFCVKSRVRPMARPRIMGKRIYQPDSCSEITKILHEQNKNEPLERPVIVDVHIHFQGPDGQVWPVSQTIGDLDNLLKSVNDSLVKGNVIADDRWIVGGETTKIFSGDDYVWVFLYDTHNEVECFKINAF